MSPTATYTPTETTMYTLRLRGGNPSPTGLSPLGTPLYGFDSAPQSTLPANYFDNRNMQPPPLDRNCPPFATVPLPRISNGPVQLNTLLEYHPNPMIDLNVAYPPTSATLNPRRRSAMGRTFDEPAVFPPTTSLTIRTPFSTTPIVVLRQGHIIRVKDVLFSIYNALCQATQPYNGTRPDSHLFSTNHYNNGGMASPYTPEQLITSFLCNRCQWEGLRESSSAPDVWVLHIR